MDSTLNDRIRHLARYWPIVVLATLLAVGGAVWTTGQSATEYTGRSALIVSSQNRAPEQDAVLVQGYVDLFNDSSYQEQLRVVGSLPADTSFSARTAAAGPILFVEATAGDAETAAEAARIMAGTFRDDVNSVRDRGREGSLEELRQRLDEERSRPGIADNVALAQLQAQISELELDATNQIQDLQLNAGVSEDSPSLFRNVALGLLGEWCSEYSWRSHSIPSCGGSAPPRMFGSASVSSRSGSSRPAVRPRRIEHVSSRSTTS